VAEQHDGHQRGQLPPERRGLHQAQVHRHAEQEGHGNRQGDQRHHPRQPVLQLTPRPLQEDQSAVEEDDCTQRGRYPFGAREYRRRVAQEVLDVVGPEHHRQGEHQGDPEPAAEHGHAVAGVLVVALVIVIVILMKVALAVVAPVVVALAVV
jgi:hypothetical protein